MWLASQGVGAGDIGSYLAVIVLPWAFKLITGPLMDRFEFLPMGRRRPWVIGAQLGRPRITDRADTATVAEHTLRADDAVNLGNDVARGHGLEPRTRNGDLQKRQFGNAIRDLYVSRQLRAFGRIKDLWFGRREIELRTVLHNAQHPNRRDDHRALIPPPLPRPGPTGHSVSKQGKRKPEIHERRRR